MKPSRAHTLLPNAVLMVLCGLAAASEGGSKPASPAAMPTDQPVDIVWKKHDVQFVYFSSSVYYSCDGLKDKTRSILRYFGAGPQIDVWVAGCGYGLQDLTSNAIVHVSFQAPAPAAAEETAPKTVFRGQWKAVTLAPDHPVGLARDECEIVHAMRDVLTQSFTIAEPKADTFCVGAGDIHGFSLSAKVLQSVPVVAKADAGPAAGARP